MSTSRTALRLSADVASTSRSVSRNSRRCLASKAGSATESTTSSSDTPTIYASLLLSRPPLLTPTPTALESTYYNYTSSVQHALSNPPSQTNPFYFKAGSLPLRRFQKSQHEYLQSTYGKDLAGPAPEIGEVPAENSVTPFARDHWEQEDSKRGEKSLEPRARERWKVGGPKSSTGAGRESGRCCRTYTWSRGMDGRPEYGHLASNEETDWIVEIGQGDSMSFHFTGS
jgi:hypothetical protein